MININEIIGAGFTIITDDLTTEKRNQEAINAMFMELQEVLNRNGFDIAIVASQEDAMRLQGKLLFDRMFKKLDALCREDSDV